MELAGYLIGLHQIGRPAGHFLIGCQRTQCSILLREPKPHLDTFLFFFFYFAKFLEECFIPTSPTLSDGCDVCMCVCVCVCVYSCVNVYMCIWLYIWVLPLLAITDDEVTPLPCRSFILIVLFNCYFKMTFKSLIKFVCLKNSDH